MPNVSPLVSGIVTRLLAESSLDASGAESATERGESGAVIALDSVAEAIGALPVTMPDIEAIFDALERAGRRVEAETKDPPAALAKVLSTVRSFSAVSGRRPTVPEMAQHSGLSIGEVRFALLYARVLVR
jgi:hypothetical protein